MRAGRTLMRWITCVVALSPNALRQALSVGPSAPEPAGLASCQEHGGVCACFAPGTSQAYMEQYVAAQFGGAADAYSSYARWSQTASGGTGALGAPITLTYSFVPDGTIAVPAGALGPGVTSVQNVLFSSMNAKFGSQAAWQNLVRDIFDDWSALTGIHYVEETQDDGATWVTSPGVLGVRGDVRIISIAQDGAFGVLAFNFYPDSGDLALDKDENWADATSDYRFLRNTMMHELGHGMGLQHVLPRNNTKLMEAVLSLNFVGPQDDDIRGAAYYYGDGHEVNDTAGTATGLGSFVSGQVFGAMSLHKTSDVDWYALDVAGGTTVLAEAEPLGGSYQIGPDPGSTTLINTLAQLPLRIDIYDAAGTTLLRTATASAAGQSAATAPATLGGAETGFTVRVSTPAGGGGVQRYQLQIASSATALHTLTVSATPSPVAVTISPADVLGRTGATTATSFTYAPGAAVTLTAPPTLGGMTFQRWTLDGTQQPLGQTALPLTLSADRGAVAVYNAVLSVSAGTAKRIVAGEAAVLTAAASHGTPPYAYAWSPATGLSSTTSASVTAMPTQTTTYTVTVTDAVAAQAAASVSVEIVPPLTVDAGPDRYVLAGQAFSLSASASGGVEPYTFAWSPPLTAVSSLTKAFVGAIQDDTEFTLTATDAAGRTAGDTVLVRVIAPLRIDAGPDQTVAAGQAASLIAAVSGGLAPHEITWMRASIGVVGAGAAISVTPSVGTLYTANVRDALGQQASDQIRVDVVPGLEVRASASPALIDAGEGSVLGAVATGGKAPYSFRWAPTDGLSAPGAAQTEAEPDETTTYVVTVQDASGQTAQANVLLTVRATRVASEQLQGVVLPSSRRPCGFGFLTVFPLLLVTPLVLRRWL
jgi:hypothetical protein